MVRMIVAASLLVVGSLLVADATVAVAAGKSMGGKAKNSYSALMCEQSPSSWFCISNAQRENLIKLKRQGCTEFECPSGYTYKPNVASLKCKALKAPTNTHAHMCDPVDDRDHCCDKLAPCSSWKCPYGWTPVADFADTNCSGPVCSMLDAQTCCKMPTVTCHEVKFKATPTDGAKASTALRTCRKEASQDADKEFTTTSSFLGRTKDAKTCFELKVEMKKDVKTARTPVIPGPAASMGNYGKPAPRPTTMENGVRVVVDAAARGDEEEICKGFDCAEGGNYLSDADAQWQQFLDISWNAATTECHSCTPENKAAKDPSAFGVSRDENGDEIKYDAVYDCACDAGFYMHNGRCVAYVADGEECFPSYGEEGGFVNANNKKMAKKNLYFPCDSQTSICADGKCTPHTAVIWDCETGHACNNAEECTVPDSCKVCGGDHLSCLDCEECYQEFKANKSCRLVENVEDYVAGDHQLIKDKLEKLKWQEKNGKDIATRTDAKKNKAAAEQELVDSEAKIVELQDAIRTQVKATGGHCQKDTEAKCWESISNDCGRPNVCKVISDGNGGVLIARVDSEGKSVEDNTCHDKFATGGGCQKAAQNKIDQQAIIKALGDAEQLVTTAKEGCSTAAVNAVAAEGADEAGDHDAADKSQKEALNACMENVKALEVDVKTQKDLLAAKKREYTRSIEDIDGMPVTCWGCIAEMSAKC